MWKPSLGRQHASEAIKEAFESYLDLLPGDKQPAIRSVHGGTPLAFDQLKEFIRTLDLARFGIGQGDRMCSCLPNGPEAAVAFLAFSCYCTYAPLNPALDDAEVRFEFDDLPAKAVVVEEGNPINKVTLAAAAEMGVSVLELTPLGGRTGAGTFSIWQARSALPAVPRELGRRGDICLVLHTSGTTAKPKIVPLTHQNVCVGALCIKSAVTAAQAPNPQGRQGESCAQRTH